MSDLQLVKGCIKGDVLSQKDLYERYSKKMMGVCLRYADNRQEAEDFLQDGFIKIFNSINNFKGTGSLEGWIRKIMVNTALENYRTANPLRLSRDIQDMHLAIEARDEILESMAAKDLLKLIRDLPSGYRIVFNLYAIEGYSHKEIARQLKITESTSKSQYSRARALLKKVVQTEKVLW
ncbi:sigma-70 family RNA polymerase sigma factor [bacterium AH-315-M05]|nr:sigma-70 family RNA polymerase sigma factor [bacterium AH-315-M05]